jgi:hypothetical protein
MNSGIQVGSCLFNVSLQHISTVTGAITNQEHRGPTGLEQGAVWTDDRIADWSLYIVYRDGTCCGPLCCCIYKRLKFGGVHVHDCLSV